MPHAQQFIDWRRVQVRLRDLICRHRGVDALRPTDVAWASRKTGIARTTLGRFLGAFAGSQTRRLQRRTILSICKGFEITEGWLLHDVQAKQMGIWPGAVHAALAASERTPAEVLLDAARALVHIEDESVQNLVARGALLGMLEVAGAERVLLPRECYAALVWLEENRDVA